MSAPTPVVVPGPLPRIAHAQNLEDILLDRIFPDQPGTYMDIGANHPLVDSNTAFFYRRGWRGVNIEPIPRLHAMFREHRPGDLNLAVAVSDVEGSTPFFEVPEGDGLSSLSAEVAAQHRARGLKVVEYEVPVRTVAGLIEEHQLEPPDFLCIDVETCEDRVLRGIPLGRWRPGALVIEATMPMTATPSYASWEPALLAHGYRFGFDNGINRFYLREDLCDRIDRLRRPVNALDQFRRFEAVYLEAQAHDLRLRVEDLSGRVEPLQAECDRQRAHLAELRAAWEWGQAQAARAQADWDRHRAEIARERASWAEALRGIEEARAQERASWAEALRGIEEARAQERASAAEALRGIEGARAQERASWAEALRHVDEAGARERAAAAEALRRVEQAGARDRAAAQHERDHHLRMLAEAQLQLRPYRLLDRLGVLNAAHGWARRVKHKLVS